MLLLPLIDDFLLLSHYFISALLRMPVLLLLLQELIFDLSQFDIALVSELIDSIVIDNFEPVKLRYGRVLLVPDRIDQLTLPLVLDEVPIVVAHVAIKLHLKFMLLNL